MNVKHKVYVIAGNLDHGLGGRKTNCRLSFYVRISLCFGDPSKKERR